MKAVLVRTDATSLTIGGGCGREHEVEDGLVRCEACAEAVERAEAQHSEAGLTTTFVAVKPSRGRKPAEGKRETDGDGEDGDDETDEIPGEGDGETEVEGEADEASKTEVEPVKPARGRKPKSA